MTYKTQAPSHLTHKHSIRVRFSEVDSLQIVWHGHYINYFEDGREAFGRQFGLSYLEIKKEGYATPIVNTNTSHKLPLRYGDIAYIETTYINTAAAKLQFSYCIKNEANQIICTGETIQVFTKLDNGEMALLHPEFYKQWKTKHNLLNV
ncbi:acyl-CoA thioesterase [Bizionia gelidisalsuginis]|uniref:Acyl-CoA thioesterase n=1 Tax=Bizionia gelidisalsuginis TaxID=291188 RepID=A0ABY3MCA3_9FLAO|nr:acyl-CoA thioesterase [Bizionia gelidisalsuginis]TYC15543.1 acyl-CoA thioesterase [Bizionia gelidisalsuginis]